MTVDENWKRVIIVFLIDWSDWARDQRNTSWECRSRGLDALACGTSAFQRGRGDLFHQTKSRVSCRLPPPTSCIWWTHGSQVLSGMTLYVVVHLWINNGWFKIIYVYIMVVRTICIEWNRSGRIPCRPRNYNRNYNRNDAIRYIIPPACLKCKLFIPTLY